MGLILDSSIVIAAERRGDPVEGLIEQVFSAFGDQDSALSSVGLTGLIHGIYRATTPELRQRRQTFIDDLLRAVTVYPYTKATAMLAGRLSGEQQAQGVTIPIADLLIGSTALSLGFSLLTVNLRHFKLIPGLTVLTL
jgi:predicted nucleic acid-binding protein